ncbi:MAG TPA: threonine synthase [Ktedonobacteraceae bacterium]|nr:threonine synthase [Ktedonobacteraceae bacterium]
MFANAISDLECVLCGKRYEPAEVNYTCPVCGPSGVLLVHYDYDRIAPHFTREQLAERRETTVWRYRALLPVSEECVAPPPLAIGGTPLYPVERLRAWLGMPHLWLKDDSRNPSASLKDRASLIAILRADSRTVACASTGNAASSLAALAAAAGLPCVIFVPQNASRAKIVQLLMCGATVFAVQGNYDQAFDLCITACERFGWYNRNTGYNPYLVEGKKTVGLEIAEQLGWEPPETILVPSGDGCIISGVYRGFEDLLQLGLIERMPRLIAVQAAGSPALVRALEGAGVVHACEAATIAEGISVSLPRNGAMAVRCIRASGGFGVTVTDEEILAAEKSLARLTGVFAEPSAAASYAGLLCLLDEGRIARNEHVVLLVTGSGLKSIEAVAEVAGNVIPLAPDQRGLEIVAARLHARS